jgi:DNA-binding response OmpR family regulator
MLPGQDGLSVLKELRAKGRKTHVLLLTARDTVADRVLGLQRGADDYLVKPFALEEFLARVQALCRRAYVTKSNQLAAGQLVIDTVSRTATLAGSALPLQAREYSLLEYLVRRAGQVVSRTEIEAHLYESQAEPMSNAVDSAVCALRRKLEAVDATQFIHTRRGQGYVLEAGKV